MGFTIAPGLLPHVGSWGSPLHLGFYHMWGHGIHHCTWASTTWGHGIHHCTWASTTCGVMGFTIAPGLLPHVGSWGSPLHLGFYHKWGHGVHHCTWASTTCGVMGFTIAPRLLPHVWSWVTIAPGLLSYVGSWGSPLHLGFYHVGSWGSLKNLYYSGILFKLKLVKKWLLYLWHKLLLKLLFKFKTNIP